MSVSAKVIIAGQNNISGAVKSAQKDLSTLAQASQKVGETLKKAFTFTAILTAVKKLGDTISSSFQDFKEAERKYKQLALTIGDTTSYNSACNTIQKLARITLEGKDSVETMVAELAALGKSSEEIDSISTAAVYLSNVTGKDLSSSMTTLLNTYNGTTTQLKKLGIDTSNLTQEELKNGAAVQVVIDKFQGLSEAMAEADSSQHIKNIKDNLGDIKQAFGQLVDFSIAPVVAKLDVATANLQTNIQNFVDDLILVLQHAPEFFSKLFETIKGFFVKFFSVENIKILVSNIFNTFVSYEKALFTSLSDLSAAIMNSSESLLKSIGNYAMYWIVSICDELGVNLTDTINSIGNWLVDSNLGKVVDQLISGTVNGIKLIAGLIKNIPSMVKLAVENIGPILSNLWQSIKNGFYGLLSGISEGLGNLIDKINLGQRIENIKVAFKNVFGNIGGGITAIWKTVTGFFDYIFDSIKQIFSWENIKNSFLGVLENIVNYFVDALNKIIDKIDWIPGIKQLEKVSYAKTAEETTKKKSGPVIYENEYQDQVAAVITSKAATSLLEFSKNMSSKVVDNSDSWKSIGEQFEALLNPVFEKFSTDMGTTVGQKLAVWESKSAEEYYLAAQENFSDISSFLTDFGKDLIADEDGRWKGVLDSAQKLGEDLFGDDVASFSTWFDQFLTQLKATASAAESTASSTASTDDNTEEISDTVKNPTFLDKLGTSIGNKISSLTGATSAQGASAGEKLVGYLTSSLGEAGDLISELAQNMASMGPMIGAIVTALKYVIEGFGEMIGPILNEFVQYGLEPFRELGRVIGQLLIPIFEDVMPLVSGVADFLISLFDSIGVALKPIIQVLSSTLTPIMSVLCNILEALMPIIKVFAKVVVTITGTIQYVVQVLQHWVASICNWLAGLNLMGWKPFKGLQMTDPGSPGSYGSYIKDKWAQVDAAFETNGTSTEDAASTSTSTAVSSAGYQGATQVTINIYQQAPVVGDGGLRDFAKMIYSEFENISYFGVTA